MQKTKYILLAVALLLPVAIHAQSFEGLWATGSALDGGTVQLPKRPDGLFRFAGALKAGELKIMTTETFVQGTTQFLKPSYVDSYLINHGLRYGLTKDESQEGWVVSFQEDTYKITIRFRHGISSDMKIRYQQYIFEIQSIVDPYMNHSLLEIYCKRLDRGKKVVT